jgi:hypothetical protein
MKINILLFIAILSLNSLPAQVSQDSEVFKQLKARDSLLFERGFNKCEIADFEFFISKDLEFYHDQGGVTTNKADFLKAVRNNICSNPKMKPIRKLQKESLEVFPLFENGKLYGAIQKGIHDFYIREPEKDLYKTSSAKFTHLWLLEKDIWILKRVLSYDHQSPE